MYCLKLTDATPKSKINLTIRQKEEFKEYYDKNNNIIMLNILVQNGIFFKLDLRLVGSAIYLKKKNFSKNFIFQFSSNSIIQPNQ